MRKAKRTMGILLAAVLLGMVPAYAAERSEMPDYFRVEFDAEQTAVEARLTFSYGRAHDDVYGSVPIGDDFYYAVDDGTQITVANANPSDTGFVYICCDIAHPRDALVGYTGESISVPGGYFVDVDEDMYYLGADGQWERSVYGVLLVGQVMGTDGAMASMLRPGESCTFTLPKDGMDISRDKNALAVDVAGSYRVPDRDGVMLEVNGIPFESDYLAAPKPIE